MNAKQAFALADQQGMAAILIGGMHAVVSKAAAERADSRGVAFSWIVTANKKLVFIPNCSADK